MTLEQRLNALAAAIAADVKNLRLADGDLTALTTTAKSNLVAALNEVRILASGGAGLIDDAASSGSKTYSSNKINALVTAAIDNLVSGAPAALDTLKEIADQLAADESAAAALATAVQNRVRFDAAQVLDSTQKATARGNIGAVSSDAVGNPDADFVAVYNAAKA